MKNIIVVTGGAGFVGSNLINFLIKKRSMRLDPTKPAPPVTIIYFFIRAF